MPECPAEEELAGYAAGACDDERATAIRAHVRACARCRRWLEEDRANEAIVPDLRSVIGASDAGDDTCWEDRTPSSDDQAGRRSPDGWTWHGIKGYEIVRELSRGGQGVVYEAYQRSTKRKVAVKVLLEGPYASPSAERRFEREVELVAGLKHPNIVVVFDSGTTPAGRRFCVMDYINGIPLGQYTRERHLALNETLAVFGELCEAVAHAHQCGIIHRDLKPSNVLVDDAGRPHVLDFGLAKQLAQPADTAITLTHAAVGTLPYMSPEQVRGDPAQIGARSDVYALGVVLYELLTGRYPYPVVGPMAEVVRNIVATPPAPPGRRRDGSGAAGPGPVKETSGAGRPLDRDVETIVLKALSKEPERRYATARELADDVRRYLAGDAIAARRDSLSYVLGKRLRRHSIALLLTAALVLAAGASVSLLFAGALSEIMRGSDTPIPPGKPIVVDVGDYEELLPRASVPGQTIRVNALHGFGQRAWFAGSLEFGHGAGQQDDGTTIEAGQVLAVDGALCVGYDSRAGLSVSLGGTLRSETGYVGRHAGAHGTVRIDGDTAVWVTDRSVYLGGDEGGPGGLGALIASNRAAIKVGDTLHIREGGELAISGASKVTAAEDLRVHRGGRLKLTRSSWITANRIEFDPGAVVGCTSGSSLRANAFVGPIFNPTNLIIGVPAGDGSGSHVVGSGGSLQVRGGIYLGDCAAGSLTIRDGGQVSSGSCMIGSGRGGHGAVTVAGPGSEWIAARTFSVGYHSQGTLVIEEGGSVRSGDETAIGRYADGPGDATVAGEGSVWIVASDPFYVSREGGGTLLVAAGGAVAAAADAIIGFAPGSEGRVTVSGTGSCWSVGKTLYLGCGGTQPEGGVGALVVAPGALVDIGAAVRIPEFCRVELRGGTLGADIVDTTGGGLFDFAAGTLRVNHVIGTLVNDGGTLTCRDSPGVLTIEGDYAQKPGAILAIRIGGEETAGTEGLSVAGTAALGGVLQVRLAEGAQGPLAERLVILTAGLIAGRFDEVRTGADTGMPAACRVEYTDTTVTLVFDRE